ncbi:HlyC/CorC family transporter [Parasphingopyxis sp. CP4]|uniref:hemolysin family protein n=1 Tax=Parasphingopyxis sp. CP4 TaxID=2724527 RepID=UPI0015A14835|nr:hemolysin family protein [Parasphingopyxis sp. CP4]QLC22238.1 HlyC/CorC family transporter [Parasphingopyxis sp. CP4]
MPEESSSTAPAENSGGRLWKGLRGLIFGENGEATLRDELEAAIDEHDAEIDDNGDLSAVERQMLKRLLHFGETTADDVCVPRADIIAIEEKESFDTIVKVFAEAGHSRLPVYRESLDEVIGMVHIRDIFAALVSDEPRPATIESFIREPRYVPESMGVLDLLAEMQTTRTHMAIVLDEYSGTEGIVTIEDIVEEIVGEIEDEHDEEASELLTETANGHWEAEARAELDDVAEIIDERLGEIDEDVDTLGGLAFVLAGRVPVEGDLLDHPSGWQLEVTEGDSKRVTRLKLHPPGDNADDESGRNEK